MIKIKRPRTPKIKVYTVKEKNLSKKERTALLKLIKSGSKDFGKFVKRLKDKDARFTKAEQETLKSIIYYADPKNFKGDKKLTNKKGPTFSVYKDDDLKEHLKTLFNKKCAYCESQFLSVSPADIEHFRPKAAINRFINNADNELIFPGYYWLAADWKNLLWSCIGCNRKRNLKVFGGEERLPLGKQNRFPVVNEKKRIRSHNEDLSREQAQKLILDPCRDDPKKHFEFPIDDDDLGIIKSKLSRNKPSKKGEASIPVYGLNRVELVLARKEEALDLRAIFTGMLRTMEAFTKKTEAGHDASEERKDFLSLKDRFKKKYAKESVYLAMKVHLLEDFKKFPLVKKLKLNIEKLLV